MAAWDDRRVIERALGRPKKRVLTRAPRTHRSQEVAGTAEEKKAKGRRLALAGVARPPFDAPPVGAASPLVSGVLGSDGGLIGSRNDAAAARWAGEKSLPPLPSPPAPLRQRRRALASGVPTRNGRCLALAGVAPPPFDAPPVGAASPLASGVLGSDGGLIGSRNDAADAPSRTGSDVGEHEESGDRRSSFSSPPSPPPPPPSPSSSSSRGAVSPSRCSDEESPCGDGGGGAPHETALADSTVSSPSPKMGTVTSRCEGDPYVPARIEPRARARASTTGARHG